MKVVFAGPSLAGVTAQWPSLDMRPPAGHGDLCRAVLDGADMIGLIDGLFGSIAAVWHKEILFALHEGVRVLGASSMGALRAAECARYGMEPIGSIANRYLDGSLDDDAAVALCHAPAELGWAPLTEPLVDVEATVVHLRGLDLITPREAEAIWCGAMICHFSVRTVGLMLANSGLGDQRCASLSEQYRVHRQTPKQDDALELMAAMAVPNPPAADQRRAWRFAGSPMWQARKAAIERDFELSRSVHAPRRL